MAGNKRITIRLTDDDRKFLYTAGGGGGRGAIQAGFDAVMRFARLMPRTFAALLRGFDDTVKEVDWLVGVHLGEPDADYTTRITTRKHKDGSVEVISVEYPK